MVVKDRQGYAGDTVLLLREAAAYARVSPATIRAAIRSGELSAVRVGRGTHRQHLRVTREALLRWLGLSETSHGETIPITGRGAPTGAPSASPTLHRR